jgi:hypothetical protein
MDRTAEYLRYADDCVRLAQQASNADSKVLLLEMAAKWRELATRSFREDSRGD